MAIHDFICTDCEHIQKDLPLSMEGTVCEECNTGTLEVMWSSDYARAASVHPSERAVVYVSEKEGGKVQFPGRNDAPVPDRLVKRGYRRVELNSIHDIKQIERRTKTASHVLHYDRGSGHSYDGADS